VYLYSITICLHSFNLYIDHQNIFGLIRVKDFQFTIIGIGQWTLMFNWEISCSYFILSDVYHWSLYYVWPFDAEAYSTSSGCPMQL